MTRRQLHFRDDPRSVLTTESERQYNAKRLLTEFGGTANGA